MTDAPRYSDRDGDVWYQVGRGMYTLHPDLVEGSTIVGGSALSEVRERYGPLVTVDEDTAPEPARYHDRDGDLWEEDDWPGVLRLVKSYQMPVVEGMVQRWDSAVEEYGPLTCEDTGEQFGAFAREDAELDLDEHGGPVSTRAEVLTVAVQLARQAHGPDADGDAVAATADMFARFILDKD